MTGFASRLGYGIMTYYASNPNLEVSKLNGKTKWNSANEFRNFLKNYLKYPIQFKGQIVRCDENVLSCKPGSGKGVFNVITAYEKNRDILLLLGNDIRWVKVEQLYNAMAKIDLKTGLPRGLLVVSKLL